MTQVISLLNLSHGGGKTTTVLNLATALHRRGNRVLALDLAPEETLAQRVRLANPARADRVIDRAKIISTQEGWHLMRAAVCVPLLHQRALRRLAPVPTIDDELCALLEAYDYVLADCSTTELSLVMEILALTHQVILPLDSESLQFQDSVEKLADVFSTRQNFNPHLEFSGVFLARYAPRFRRAREMLTTVFEVMGNFKCFAAYLPESNEIRQAEQRKRSVIADAPSSAAAHTFCRLAEELAAAPAHAQIPVLMHTPGRALTHPALTEGSYALNMGTLPTWQERAESNSDLNQAVRYAVLALAAEPGSAAALAVFETRLTERIHTARYEQVESIVELGKFLADHEFYHYAAQLFRRATELNPAHVNAWSLLARVSQEDGERAFATDQYLGLDRGQTSAEMPEPPRRPRPLVGTLFSSPQRVSA